MRAIFLFLFALTCLLSSVSCGQGDAVSSYSAPSLLPFVTSDMKTPGFWISRHSFADKIILNSGEIKDFNRHIESDLHLTRDFLKFPMEYSGKDLKKDLKKIWNEYSTKNFYFKNAKRTDRTFFEDIEKNINMRAISDTISVHFGLIVHFSDQRFLPTTERLFERRGAFDFDELQNSDLDCATPVVILHQSFDRKWFYVLSDNSFGWVEAKNVALCRFEDFKNYISADSFAVVMNPKIDIFLNPELTEYFDYARMGVKFPLKQSTDSWVEVQIPARGDDGIAVFKKVYLKKEDAHEGYLSYTSRQIMTQAFKLLNAPYGWGGMNGEQDCSRFLCEIFGTVGIALPRDSKDQGQAGHLFVEFLKKSDEKKRLSILERAAGGITLLQLKGHIMLYLGMVEGRAYAIHATHSYLEHRGWHNDIERVVNRVVVSDLSLGEGTWKGSWLRRILRVVVMDNE